MNLCFKEIIFFVFLNIFFLWGGWAKSPLGQIPIQDRGRIKPLESFSSEMLQLIHGSKNFKEEHSSSSSKGLNVERDPVEIIFTFILAPEQWENTPFIKIDNPELKKILGLKVKGKYFSVSEILSKDSFLNLIEQVSNKSNRQDRLNPLDQAAQKLETQLKFVRWLQSGEAFRLVPNQESETWKSINELEDPIKEQFALVMSSLVKSITQKMTNAPFKEENTLLDQHVKSFIQLVQKQNPEKYADLKQIRYELTYNKVKPFKIASIFYFLSFLIMFLFWILKTEDITTSFNLRSPLTYAPGMWWGMSFLGLAFHIYGFFLRTMISGRAPVTNMYETVVWVPLGVIFFGMLIEYFKRNRFTLMAANIGAFFALLLAHSAPNVLDPSIQPLEAVLRSNFWLSTHVVIIVISYSAFFLAFVLGDINLIHFARNPKKWAKRIKSINDSIYRAIQIGVLLLAIGIVLGGIWADYSWGRFWGWDPKETWALIALLGYIAVLHARLVGWVKSFGLSASAVAVFSLVIMAWYGVNYVLGAGLHSYGFGAGGVEYVTAFVVLHFLMIGVVWLIKDKQ